MTEQVKKRLEEIRTRIQSIQDSIYSITSEEEDYMWNIPENLQNSDRYYAAEEAVDNLESAADAVSEADDELGELLEEGEHE